MHTTPYGAIICHAKLCSVIFMREYPTQARFPAGNHLVTAHGGMSERSDLENYLHLVLASPQMQR